MSESLVMCLRRVVAEGSSDDASADRWALKHARRLLGSVLLRSPTRVVITWPIIEGYSALQFAHELLDHRDDYAIGAASGELAPSTRPDAPAVWGRAAILATRLAESARVGECWLEAGLAASYPKLPVEAPVEADVGKGGRLQVRPWRGALPQRSVTSWHDQLESMISRVEGRPNSESLVGRLGALAHLAEGKTGEALSRLRGAAESTSGVRDRCRASLAYGVGLATVGRGFEAMLETMMALAHARRAGDRRGEDACIRFLAELAAATNQLEAREALEEITS